MKLAIGILLLVALPFWYLVGSRKQYFSRSPYFWDGRPGKTAWRLGAVSFRAGLIVGAALAATLLETAPNPHWLYGGILLLYAVLLFWGTIRTVDITTPITALLSVCLTTSFMGTASIMLICNETVQW